MNRTLIRGVFAGSIGAAAVAVAVVVGPAIANGAEGSPPTSQAADVVAWPQPTVKELKALVAHGRTQQHHGVRSHQHRASRASQRAALSPQEIAHAMLRREGGSEAQWSCLNGLWTRESNWNVYASNPSSGAYGIPQALPSYKMASVGSDWRTNPVTQIRWGLGYIASRYGSPCAALAHSNSYGYY